MALSAPHARGFTAKERRWKMMRSVCPACAGIYRWFNPSRNYLMCLPRMRGDLPLIESVEKLSHVSAPHARGFTDDEQQSVASVMVCPACAGIYLNEHGHFIQLAGLPRMRGDLPVATDREFRLNSSTPHTRGFTAVQPLARAYPSAPHTRGFTPL